MKRKWRETFVVGQNGLWEREVILEDEDYEASIRLLKDSDGFFVGSRFGKEKSKLFTYYKTLREACYQMNQVKKRIEKESVPLATCSLKEIMNYYKQFEIEFYGLDELTWEDLIELVRMKEKRGRKGDSFFTIYDKENNAFDLRLEKGRWVTEGLKDKKTVKLTTIEEIKHSFLDLLRSIRNEKKTA